MSRIAGKLGWALAALIVLMALACVVYARRTLPPMSGATRVAGLHAPVTVARDPFGVPHIYASDEHDAYVAQGYITAQDRLWQMLVRRQAAQGALSKWLGPEALLADGVLRRQDFYTQAQAAPLDAETRARYAAYALGVNACLGASPEPIEVTWLKWQGKLDLIEPWSPEDSLALASMLTWAQTLPSAEGLRQDISNRVGAQRLDDLWPAGNAAIDPAPPVEPAARQVLQLAGIPLISAETEWSAPTLPAPWYVLTWRADEMAATGASWPGVPELQRFPAARNAPRYPWPDKAAANALVQRLLALPPEGWLQFRVHGLLRQWGGDLDRPGDKLSNASTAVYMASVWHLARAAFQDELGPDLFSRYWDTGLAPAACARLIERPGDLWWDDQRTPQPETRDDILRRAYAGALDDLGRHYGDLHTIWEWDALHAVALRHALGHTGLPGRWLNRTIKWNGLASFDPARPADPMTPYAPRTIPALPMNEQGFALAGGQSGRPLSPHYADLLPLWARGQLVPLEHPHRPEELKTVEGVLLLLP
jgi:acyl-homoserine lactone acylase PvdQ